MPEQKAQPASEELKQHGDPLANVTGRPERDRTATDESENAEPKREEDLHK